MFEVLELDIDGIERVVPVTDEVISTLQPMIDLLEGGRAIPRSQACLTTHTHEKARFLITPQFLRNFKCFQSSHQQSASVKGNEEKRETQHATRKVNLKTVLKSGQSSKVKVSDLSAVRYPKLDILYEYEVSNENKADRSLWEYIEYCMRSYTENTFDYTFEDRVPTSFIQRRAKCNGVYQCSTPNCNNVQPRSIKNKKCEKCSAELKRSDLTHGRCNVVFIYLYSHESNKQYLLSLDKTNKGHNHEDPPYHQVPKSIRNLIQGNIITDPELKGRELIQKLNLVQMCPSLTNIGRASYTRKRALDSLFGKGKATYSKILNAEACLQEKYGKKTTNLSDHIDLNEFLFPYVRVSHVDVEGLIVHTQHLVQSLIAADSKYLVADVKHGKNSEGLHHLGIATFSEELRKAVIVSRTRVSKLDSVTYQLAFEYFFQYSWR